MKITTKTELTKDCLKDFHYRDSNFNAWLPKKQSAKSGEITIVQLSKAMTFLEMAQNLLGSTDIEIIKKHTLTLPMVEKMVKSHEDELHTNGYGNFFFTEDKDGSVSVGRVYRHDVRDWNAYVHRLGGDSRWIADSRFLLCNLDTRANFDTSTTIDFPDVHLGVAAARKLNSRRLESFESSGDLEKRIEALEEFEKKVRNMLVI